MLALGLTRIAAGNLYNNTQFAKKENLPFQEVFVPRTGFEPARPFEHHHLKVACLPVSTPGQVIFKTGTQI
jgi:hypothetical protein